MNNSVPDIPLCIREENAIVWSKEDLLFNRVLIIVYDAAVVSVYKSHIFVLFKRFYWLGRKMEWDGGGRQNNNILLDVQYHLKAFLLSFFFFLKRKCFRRGAQHQWRCLSFRFSPALKWSCLKPTAFLWKRETRSQLKRPGTKRTDAWSLKQCQWSNYGAFSPIEPPDRWLFRNGNFKNNQIRGLS